MKVCVDAGHGGEDSGAVGPAGTRESVVNLGIARMMADEIRMRGHKAVLTREHNTDVTLARRCRIANEQMADAFVSVHCNADGPEAHGVETYHYPGSEAGRALASRVHGAVLSRFPGLADRKVKEAKFYVLKHTKMPACLVECAFLSNPEEERLLGDVGNQRLFAEGIAEGVLQFLQEPGRQAGAT